MMKPKSAHHMSRLLVAAVLGSASLWTLSVPLAEVRPAREAQTGAHEMEAQWQELQRALLPEVVIRLGEKFQRDYPHGPHQQSGMKILEDARKVFRAQQEARLSTEALNDPAGDGAYRGDLMLALRADKNAAYRIGLMYRQGTHGLAKDPLRSTQWLRVAAELGNGRASWEVANIYNRDGEMAEAARFEAKAVRDGFVIPPRLPNRGLTN
jgi:TPR repeat protein